MPTTRQQQRHLALGRKGAYEIDFLFIEPEEDIEPQPAPLKKHKDSRPAEPVSKPSSPISVASALSDLIAGEIKSLSLPGAWVVVGKGGRPLRNDKMYDEPSQRLTAKKKKKTRARKVEAEAEPLLTTLDEAASSSKSLHEFERSTARRTKEEARSKDAKRWARHQHVKQLKRNARDELVAALLLSDDAAEATAGAPPKPKPNMRPTRDNKANRSKDKARRRARSAAALARCSIECDELADVCIERALAKAALPSLETRPSGELQLCFGRSGRTEADPPGEWTTVGKRGKRGKAASDHPVNLKPSDKAVDDDKQTQPAKKRGKGMQCSVM